MARKSIKKEQTLELKSRTFKVIEKFKGFVNNDNFECKVDDIIELSDFQAKIFTRFIKEIQ